MPKEEYEATSGIQLEPHDEFKAAIVGVNARGEYIYEYDKLVDVCISLHDFSAEDAQEWVEYNIVGLAPNGFEVRHGR